MSDVNKKADENTAISSPAQKNRADSFRLSDKIKVLYRYFKLPKVYKGAVFVAIDTFYKESLKDFSK